MSVSINARHNAASYPQTRVDYEKEYRELKNSQNVIKINKQVADYTPYKEYLEMLIGSFMDKKNLDDADKKMLETNIQKFIQDKDSIKTLTSDVDFDHNLKTSQYLGASFGNGIDKIIELVP